MANLVLATSNNAMGTVAEGDHLVLLQQGKRILTPGLFSLRTDRDIGGFASWSVSSSKPGFEVEQLTDPSTSTFWQ